MAERRLSPEEAALWARVLANVRPIRPTNARMRDAGGVPPVALGAKAGAVRKVVIAGVKRNGAAGTVSASLDPPKGAVAGVRNAQSATLDGSWDRTLARGTVAPDRTVDLHGLNLAAAHAALDRALNEAIGRGERVLLLITGKPPRAASERPHARGAIRAAIADWLAVSRHAGGIAAVRAAHPRHGGAGALYIVLRRPRG